MWMKITNFVLTHLVQSVVVLSIVVVGIGCASYFAFQSSNLSDNVKESTSGSDVKSCVGFVNIGVVTVEPDPAGDPEAWIRFDYTNSNGQAFNCKYTITFYDSQENIVRTIPNTEDIFQSPSGQIGNGYSSTEYQSGMTARVTFQ